MRGAFLASGEGTNLDAIAAAGIVPTLVMTDGPCRALSEANRRGFCTSMVRRRGKFSAEVCDDERVGFTREVTELLVKWQIDVVFMVGWMTVLSPEFFAEFEGRVVNTHPSLFDGSRAVFPGSHAVRDALRAGVRVTGCTQHIANPTIDCGFVLAAAPVSIPAIFPEGMDEQGRVDIVQEMIKVLERRHYPRLVKSVLSGDVNLPELHRAWLAGEGRGMA